MIEMLMNMMVIMHDEYCEVNEEGFNSPLGQKDLCHLFHYYQKILSAHHTVNMK